ncbi:MAG: sugar phosphate isomerase/epimerase [Fimbriimonadaceae bacterium]|nr:sugar phosphate isomerase/epimerase [Fimbriimonadaceae bacterium]
MNRTQHQDIRIGTLAGMSDAPSYLAQIVDYGFESFELTNWAKVDVADLEEHAKEIQGVIGGKAVISSIGCYGNPLTDAQTAADFGRLIRNAKAFGCDVVCGFAGALEDRPADESIPRFREVWGELARVADGEGIRIAFENCDMGGTWDRPKWNIAHSPKAWSMMFDSVDSQSLGLEWEPCHQMVSLIEPLPQLKEWIGRVYHIHGKDATIERDVLARQGLRSGETFVWHRTPGFGDTNWTDLISILRMNGWTGAIDIEGWHDPVYKDDLEMTGQVHSMNYLKACRGGAYVPNPN